ncbi:hypothetical protein [Spirillospora sp. NPDC029432]|uniref:hypothetical protein n=1 Tax=Spirillospora sp. NPDC029432 TaxID=3154599 RepID=UPI0034555B03
MVEGARLAAVRALLAHRLPRLFAWDVAQLGAGGVSDDAAVAAERLLDALRDAPAGAEGVVRRVALGAWCEYVDLGEVARARRDAGGEVVVWWPSAFGGAGTAGAPGDGGVHREERGQADQAQP